MRVSEGSTGPNLFFSGAKAPKPRLAFGSAGGALGVARFGESVFAPRGTLGACVGRWPLLGSAFAMLATSTEGRPAARA